MAPVFFGSPCILISTNNSTSSYTSLLLPLLIYVHEQYGVVVDKTTINRQTENVYTYRSDSGFESSCRRRRTLVAFNASSCLCIIVAMSFVVQLSNQGRREQNVIGRRRRRRLFNSTMKLYWRRRTESFYCVVAVKQTGNVLNNV